MPKRGEFISNNQITGQTAINLIERVVLEMAHAWRNAPPAQEGHPGLRVGSVALPGFCWKPGMRASLIAGRQLPSPNRLRSLANRLPIEEFKQ
jgi:hypothetical protein